LCLKPAAVQICPYVLNGALLLEHNVAYYFGALLRVSGIDTYGSLLVLVLFTVIL